MVRSKIRKNIARYIWLVIAVSTVFTNSFIGILSSNVAQAGIGGGFSSVSAGQNNTCALSGGRVYCWGDNTYGQLGNGTTSPSTLPTAVDTSGVLSGKTIDMVGVGGTHVCVLASGTVYCWGRSNVGQVGSGAYGSILLPVAVDTSGVLSGKIVSSISIGQYHSCAIAGGAVYCWGWNNHGQIGDGTTTANMTKPVAVSTVGALGGKTVTSISLGNYHTCAIAGGAVYCWGWNSSGRLGNPAAVTLQNTPIAVDTTGVLNGKSIDVVAAGGEFTCALSGGNAYCWGRGDSGQLGENATSNEASPIAVNTSGVLNGKILSAISSGQAHTCALSLGQIYCWGINTNGALGDSTQINRLSPVSLDTDINISSGSYRLYKNQDNSAPGAPLAAVDTPAQQTYAHQPFRLRIGVSSSTLPIPSNKNTFILQYAERTAVSCSQQSSGYSAVTSSSPIAFYVNSSTTNGAAISTTADDPTTGNQTIPLQYWSAQGSFSNQTDLPSGSTGLFDFSLIDSGAQPGTPYCLRVSYSNGSPLEMMAQYPTITTAPAEMLVGIVNSSGDTVGSPVYPLGTTIVKSVCQTVNGTLGTASQQLQVYNNLSSTGWSLSIAASDGPSSLWSTSGGAQYYDFNDSSGSPAGCNSGSDGDGYAGQLTINPSGASISSPNGCSSSGISLGTAIGFDQSAIDTISLGTGSSSTPVGCQWNFTGIGMSQTIPPSQPAGTYTLTMMMTMVAQ